MRRVVVTGLGLLTPLGAGVAVNWRRLIAGQSGIAAIEGVDVSDLPCRIAGQIPGPDDQDGGFDPSSVISVKDQRKSDPFIIFALAAASEAIADSGWTPQTDEDRYRTGTLIGSGIGGLQGIADGAVTLSEKGPRRISPFFIPANLINLASGQVSIRFGLRGPNHAVVTACSTGAHAIGDAARLIALDDADVMVAGGAEYAVTRLGIAGFSAMRALSTGYNDTPDRASRPYDQGRDGFVMGDGAGIVVLEEYEHAKRRGARIYAEIVGYGLSGDAYHVTAPAEDGNGALRAMRAALKRAGLRPSDVDYVNAHGTSTPLGDDIELGAVRKLFDGDPVTCAMSSTKSAIGHLLGAAGAVEAIYGILAIRDQVVPPTLNLDAPSPAADGIELVPHRAQERRVDTVLSNSFGFGGTNATLVLQRVAD